MPDLTPAELAEGLEKCEPGMIYELDERIRWFELHGRAALRELAALRAQRDAERAARERLVAEFRRRCQVRKEPLSPPHGWPSSAAAAWHDAAVLLAALDAPAVSSEPTGKEPTDASDTEGR